MAANLGQLPALDGQLRWCSSGNPCTAWSLAPAAQPIAVDDLPSQRLETTVQYVDDPSAGTTTNDTLALGVKVWFIPGSTVDNEFNRVFVRTLRTPNP